MAYPTLSQLKAYLGVSDATDDTPLTQHLNAAIARMERETGRLFVAASSTVTYRGRRPFVSRDRRTLNLMRDLVSLTTLTNGDAIVITSTYYELVPFAAPYHQVRLIQNAPYVFAESGNTGIAVQGNWGYSTSCPNDVFLAIMELADYAYKLRSTGGTGQVQVTNRGNSLVAADEDIPKSVKAVMQAYRRSRA